MVYISETAFQKMTVCAAFVLAMCLSSLGIAAASNPDSLQALDLARVNAPAQMKTVIRRIAPGRRIRDMESFGRQKPGNRSAQSGGGSERLVSLHGTRDLAPQEKSGQKDLFFANREVIRIIYQHNRKILSGLQEKFDHMADPMKIFKSPEWKEPQDLAAKAGYRLGWNDYYAVLSWVKRTP